MKEEQLFNNYNQYLKKKYKTQVYRVSIDAGFSCPHRGTERDKPGCTFCDNHGSRAPYLGNEDEVKKQITGGISFLKKRYKANDFLLYFQAFSSTYAPLATLKKIYDTALDVYTFKEMIISTRPDCLPEAVVQLLADYITPEREIWVELGLQTSHATTLERINRGHGLEEFLEAFHSLRQKGIKIAVHLIFGLPGEGWPELADTIRLISTLMPEGLKIHNLHIPLDTEMYQEYLQGELTAPHHERHLAWIIQALELLPPQTVIMRLTCDTPANRLAAPRNFLSKSTFYEAVKIELYRQNTWQGKHWVPPQQNGR